MSSTAEEIPRRKLRFESVSEILADAEAIARAPVRTSGTWTAGQIVQHIADAMYASLDGFPLKAPMAARLKARATRGVVLKRGFPTGVKLRGDLEAFLPATVPLEKALERLRSAADRIEREEMTEDHPFFGRLTHKEWIALHCRHAELHFSFMHPESAQAAPGDAR